MITIEEDSEHKTFIITVKGFIDFDNANSYLRHLKRRLDDWDEIKIVKIVEKFEGIDFKGFLNILVFYMKHLKQFKKCALITHNLLSGWQGFLGSFFAFIGFIISIPLICKFKHFSFNKIHDAKEWIQESDFQEAKPTD